MTVNLTPNSIILNYGNSVLLEIIYGYNLINKDIKTIKRVIHGVILKKTVFLKLIGFLKLSINSYFSFFHNLKFTTFSSSSSSFCCSLFCHSYSRIQTFI